MLLLSPGIVTDEDQGDARGVDGLLAGLFEIDGHPVSDHGLNLAQAPIGLARMAHQNAGL